MPYLFSKNTNHNLSFIHVAQEYSTAHYQIDVISDFELVQIQFL